MAWWMLATVGAEGREVIFTLKYCPLVFSIRQRQDCSHIQISSRSHRQWAWDSPKSERLTQLLISKTLPVFTVGSGRSVTLLQIFAEEKTRRIINIKMVSVIFGWSVCPAITGVFWGHAYATGSPVGFVLKDWSVSSPHPVARQRELSD